MKVAIVSDIHDHRVNFSLLLDSLQKMSLDYLILLWDYWAPGTIIKNLLRLWIPTYAIRWNNDGEIYKTMQMFFEHKDHAHIARRSYDRLELDTKKIFLTHYHDLALPMASTWLYDAVFFGHNHTSSQQMIGNCLLANPGAILWDKTPASFAVWDTQTNIFDIILL